MPAVEALSQPNQKLTTLADLIQQAVEKMQARVWVKRGTGQVTINGRKLELYFARPVLQMILAQPFEATERVGEFDVCNGS